MSENSQKEPMRTPKRRKVSKVQSQSTTSKPAKVTTKTTNKRTRTGCFPCRSIHKKCDETRPACLLCVKRNQQCTWPNIFSTVITGSSGGSADSPNTATRTNSTLSRSNNSVKTVSRIPRSPVLCSSLLKDDEHVTKYSRDLLESLSKRSLSKASTSTDLNASPQSNESSIYLGELHSFPGPHITADSNQKSSRKDRSASCISSPFSESSMTSLSGSSAAEPLDGLKLSTIDSALSRMPMSQEPALEDVFMMNFDELHNTLRDFMFTNANSNWDYMLQGKSKPTSFDYILNPEHPSSLADSSGVAEKAPTDGLSTPADRLGPRREISLPEQHQLVKNYFYEVADWLDMFDISKQFSRVVPELAKTDKSLLYALYAISSRQLERTVPGYPGKKTNMLFQESLNHLIPSVKQRPSKTTIASCVLLCVMDMMSLLPSEWRHHLEGCSALFRRAGIHGFSEPFERGLFWCFVRTDVDAGVIDENPTVLNPVDWMPPGVPREKYASLFLQYNSADMYSNYSIFLCARVLSLVYQDTENYDREWLALWGELEEWYDNRSFEMVPFLEYEENPFPSVLYLNGPAISANQVYHMAVIIMMENKPRLQKVFPATCVSKEEHQR